MARRYDPTEFEPTWVKVWEDEGLYRASDDPDDPRPRFYALDMFPYPSGDLHMGHAEAFSGGDAVARYRTMRGFNVLHPIGWDAFGLPAENAAIKRGVDRRRGPTRTSSSRPRRSSGWGCRSTGPDACRPATRRTTGGRSGCSCGCSSAGWPTGRTRRSTGARRTPTVLANEQVIGGACERCGTTVERRELTQWFFKITDYAQRLLDDVDELAEWPERVLTMQRNWIGRSEGAEVTFTIDETGEEIPVFTTRPDTLWGVTFFVFAVEHPAVQRLAELGGTWDEVRPLVEAARATSTVDRAQADTKEGVALGVHAVNPVNGERVPCYAAPYVLMEYGTGRDHGGAGARPARLRVRARARPAGPGRDPAAGGARRPRRDDRGDAPRRRDGQLGPVRRRAVARVDREGDRLAGERRGAAARRCTSGCATG